jgi:Ca2+-transporting ATPase
MHIEAGDVISVDAVLVDGYNVLCDESAATGESESLKKLPADKALQATQPGAKFNKKYDPFILSGSKVLGGVGRCIVTAVGVNSYHGRTMIGTPGFLESF